MDLSNLSFDLTLIWQLLPLTVVVGILGGLFSRITLYFVQKLIINSKIKVLVMALGVGMIVAFFNYLSKGQIAGSGHTEVLQVLNSQSLGLDFVVMKFFAVLTSFVSTLPGGVFMPSISIGAGIGAEASHFYTQIDTQVIMLIAMIGYLSAVIRAPLTSAFVILEMTMSLHLLIPALVVALIASFVSKQIQHQPIYEALADRFSKTV